MKKIDYSYPCFACLNYSKVQNVCVDFTIFLSIPCQCSHDVVLLGKLGKLFKLVALGNPQCTHTWHF